MPKGQVMDAAPAFAYGRLQLAANATTSGLIRRGDFMAPAGLKHAANTPARTRSMEISSHSRTPALNSTRSLPMHWRFPSELDAQAGSVEPDPQRILLVAMKAAAAASAARRRKASRAAGTRGVIAKRTQRLAAARERVAARAAANNAPSKPAAGKTWHVPDPTDAQAMQPPALSHPESSDADIIAAMLMLQHGEAREEEMSCTPHAMQRAPNEPELKRNACAAYQHAVDVAADEHPTTQQAQSARLSMDEYTNDFKSRAMQRAARRANIATLAARLASRAKTSVPMFWSSRPSETMKCTATITPMKQLEATGHSSTANRFHAVASERHPTAISMHGHDMNAATAPLLASPSLVSNGTLPRAMAPFYACVPAQLTSAYRSFAAVR